MKDILLLDIVSDWKASARSSEIFICKMIAVIQMMKRLDYHIYNKSAERFSTQDSLSDLSMMIWEMYHGHGIGHLTFKHKEG